MRAREVLFAAVPLLFAVQQLWEGFVWLDLEAGRDASVSAQGYTFFARVVWPVWIPVAVLAIEAHAQRRRIQAGLALLGAALAVWFLAVFLLLPVEAVAQDGHIVYWFPNAFRGLAAAVYLLATCGSLLVSSHPWVRAFGWTTLAGAAVAYALAAASFASVWCYVAALLSVLVLVHMRRRRTEAAASQADGPRTP